MTASGPRARRPATVLVVDGQEANRWALSRALERAGFAVVLAATGREAAERAAAKPDVVVLDVALPDGDGFEVAQRLKANAATAQIPILFVSAGHTSAELRGRGAEASLTRPVDDAVLIATVNSLLRLRDVESDRRLRSLFDAIPVPTFTWRATGNDFELHDWNEAAVEFTNGKLPEWRGARIREMYAEDYGDYMKQALATGRPVRAELRHRLKSSGEERDLSLSFAPVPPDLVMVHTIDVTERRAAQRDLQAREERFRALAENATELVSILDRDGNFQYVSPNYRAVVHYEPAELVGKQAFALAHPDEAVWLREVFGEIVAQRGMVREATMRVRDGKGEWRMMSVVAQNLLDHPAIRGVVCNTRDVTAQHAAAEELRFQAHLLDAVEQAVIATRLDGTVTFWNRYAERLFGWAPEEAAGRDVAQLTARARSAEALQQLQRRESWSGEVTLRTRFGRELVMRVTDSPLLDATGALVGVVCVCEDVSQRRLLEEQLRQSQKLEAIGKLAGGVAHDFNNLLTVIRTNAELAQPTLPEGSPALGDLAEIRAAVDRATALTRQLLAFSRKQVLSPQPLDLNAVVTSTQRMLQRLIGEDVTLQTQLGSGLGAILADAGQLEQVLLNLAVNSRDAMPDGGTLSITTGLVQVLPDQSALHGGAPPGTYVVLTVRDTGHGMNRDVREHLFEPFFTTKGAGHGTGLGLSMVHGIVKQSGGYIRVASEPGQGALFAIYFPREQAPSEQPPPPSVGIVGGSDRVLLVEDDAGVRAGIRRMLERLGYRVTSAANGLEAVETFRAQEGRFDVLVTDTVMPGMGGRELVETLRREQPSLRVLYMSGYTEDEVVRRGVDPTTGFIQKPFTADVLSAAIRRTLDSMPPR